MIVLNRLFSALSLQLNPQLIAAIHLQLTLKLSLPTRSALKVTLWLLKCFSFNCNSQSIMSQAVDEHLKTFELFLILFLKLQPVNISWHVWSFKHFQCMHVQLWRFYLENVIFLIFISSQSFKNYQIINTLLEFRDWRYNFKPVRFPCPVHPEREERLCAQTSTHSTETQRTHTLFSCRTLLSTDLAGILSHWQPCSSPPSLSPFTSISSLLVHFLKAGGEKLGSFQLNTTIRALCHPLRTRGNI